jgi:hypothetical protein
VSFLLAFLSCSDVLTVLLLLLTDPSTLSSLIALKPSTLAFIRFHTFYLAERFQTVETMRSIFESKEKNKQKSLNKQKAHNKQIAPTSDVAKKLVYVQNTLSHGLKECNEDEIAKFHTYLNDLDPLDSGSSDSLPAPTLASSLGRPATTTSGSAQSSTRPPTRDRLVNVFVRVELGCAELGCAELGLAELGCAELGCAELGCAELGCAELGCAELGLAVLGCLLA